jgi:hypothetical protein
MARETSPDSYIHADPTLLKEIIADGEARLAAQLTTSLAADQRALLLAGFLVPTIVALGGAAAALFLQTPPNSSLAWIALVASAGLFISLALLIYAARPIDWHLPGVMPGAWIGDIEAQRPDIECLAELAADAHDRASYNAGVMGGNGKRVNLALWIAAGTLALCGLTIAVLFGLGCGR